MSFLVFLILELLKELVWIGLIIPILKPLGKLSNINKMRLKEFGLEKEDIKQIEIQLELVGLNLNVSL